MTHLALLTSLLLAAPADETAGWHRGLVDPDRSPVDLRFLNHRPAGKHGAVQVDGDRFVFSGTGEEARFWGCNVAAYALVATTDENIQRQAARIAAWGYNLVRLHHVDSGWVNPNLWNEDGTLNEAALNKLDWWIHCLAEEGVYCWLDLHVGRRFHNERIKTLAEMESQKPKSMQRQGKGFCYLDNSLRQVMLESQNRLLDHVNPYRARSGDSEKQGVPYKDDPAIALLTITNENELRHSHRLLKDEQRYPILHGLFKERAQRFAGEHDFKLANVMRNYGKPAFLFRNQVEHEFNQAMSCGLTKPYCTTSIWGSNPYGNLASLTDGSFIDVHDYGPAKNILQADPKETANIASRIAAFHVLDKPLTVSEYNVVEKKKKSPLRFVLPLYMAGVASLNRWDALCIYTYSQTKLPPGQWGGNLFNTVVDPCFATVPAAALAYRRGDISPSFTRYVVPLDRKDQFSTRSYRQNLSCRTLAERGQFSVALTAETTLPWLKPTKVPQQENVKKIAGINVDLLGEVRSSVRSDTAELRRNWDAETHWIQTPRTQAVQGRIGGRRADLDDVAVLVDSSVQYATVCVSSLTDKPIAESEEILLTVVARGKRPDKGAIYLSQPVQCELELRAPPGLQVFPRSGSGTNGPPIAARYRDGRYFFKIGDAATHWYVLKRAG